MEEILKKQLINKTFSQVYIFEGEADRTRREYLAFSKGLLETEKDIESQIEIIRPQNKNISIDEIRGLRKRFFERPSEFRYRISVIEDANTMRKEAQNALLKSLEELPPYSIVIMTCKNRYRLESTILSRSQLITLKSLDEDGLDGELYREVLDFLSRLGNKKYYLINKEKDLIKKFGEDKEVFLDILFDFFSRLYIYKKTGRTEDRSKNFDKFINIPTTKIEDIILFIEEIKGLLNVNINFQLALEEIVYKIMEA